MSLFPYKPSFPCFELQKLDWTHLWQNYIIYCVMNEFNSFFEVPNKGNKAFQNALFWKASFPNGNEGYSCLWAQRQMLTLMEIYPVQEESCNRNFHSFFSAQAHGIHIYCKAVFTQAQGFNIKLMVLSNSTFCCKFSTPLCSNATWQRHSDALATNGPSTTVSFLFCQIQFEFISISSLPLADVIDCID